MFKTFHIYNRPISPHLLIYSPQLSSLCSIWHRITGVILASLVSFFLLILKIWSITNFQYLVFLSNSLISVTYLNWLANYLYLIILLLLVYHILNGLRHIIWDIGLFLNNKFLLVSSLFSFFILTLVLIINII